MDAATVVLLAAAAAAPPLRGEAVGASGRPEAAGLRRALERAIADPRERRSLRLMVECQRDAGFASVRVFGSGLGIWNDERQFALSPERLGALLRAVRDADLPGLEDSYGGTVTPELSPPGGALVTKLTCQIELALGGYQKQVVQLARGEQSTVLKRLAGDLLAACEPLARAGLGASSLEDGLEKISRGHLAPETWSVVAHRKPDPAGAGEGHAGFLLSIAGRRATSQTYAPVTSYGPELVLELTPTEVRTLARELRARRPAAWPVNLQASRYTDLSLRVLNHQRSVQARRFAGRPAASGEHEKTFEQAFERLERIHRNVQARGSRPRHP